MYDESKYINIDVFKDNGLYRYLEQYNPIVEQIARSANYQKEGDYNVEQNEASFWFNPDKQRKTWFPQTYPKPHPIQEDIRLNLCMHCANCASILLINTLFQNRKYILIEDICCGMGNFIFYLSKLGFNNFAAIDNFSQLPKSMFTNLMKEGNIKYTLNDFENNPIVTNIIAFTKYVKRNVISKERMIVDGQDHIHEVYGPEIIPDSIELFLTYYPINPGNNNLHIDNDKFFERFTPLSKDSYGMIYGYCRNDKYNEFQEKLQAIKL